MKQGRLSRSRPALLACLLLLLSALAACGQGSGTTAPTTAPGTASTAAPGTASTAAPGQPTEGAETAQPGTGQADQAELAPPNEQILRVRLVADPETLDPALDENTSEETVIKQLFTGLTRVKADLTPEGAIAESWTFNDTNTQITFTLRDTKWSDGQPLTAQDFVYAWKRFLDPRTASPYAALVTGVIKGATELNTAPISDTAVLQQQLDALGVRAVDARTLQVDLERPAPYFLSIVALGNMSPLRQDVIEQHGDRWTEPGNIVGNGPFILQNRTVGSELNLAPNPNYYEGAPTLTSLIFRSITDDPTALANYRSDELDINDQVPPAEVPGLRDNPQFQDQIFRDTRLTTYFYAFNTTQPPFNDVKVRQAVAYAIDRQTITDQVLNGVPTPAYSFIPPGMPGHLSEAEAGDAAQTFNPERAKQLLAEAGFPNGQGFPEIRLAFNNCCSHDLIAQRVQADLQTNLGIRVALDPREATTYFSEVRRNPPSMFRQGWNADYADPFDWGPLVFGPDSEQNYGRWQNAEFAQLIEQAEAAQTPEERLEYYRQAEQVLAQDVGAAFIYWYGRFALIKPWVRGLTYTAQDPTLGAYSYKDVQILRR